jgi:integrase
MARHHTERCPLPDGRVVGYRLDQRGGYWHCIYPDPADPLRPVQRSTGEQHRASALSAAAQLILAAYTHTLPPAKRAVTWGEVADEIARTATIRPSTREDYCKAIRMLRAAVETGGPNDVDEAKANRFKRVYSAGSYARGKSSTARRFPRSPNTVRAALRKLSSLWAKHLRELGYVVGNPWERVAPPPALRRKPSVPTDETVREFFAWLDARFPGWPLPRLLFEVKALTASRTSDLCGLKSDQLRGGRLVFRAEDVKGRADRSIPLPADLAAALEALKGPAYLWESFGERQAGGGPFVPRKLFYFVGNVVEAFNASRPGQPRLTPHGFRRRALTVLTLATGSADAAAQAVGVDPATARRYYIDATAAYNADALFEKVADKLRPNSGGAE